MRFLLQDHFVDYHGTAEDPGKLSAPAWVIDWVIAIRGNTTRVLLTASSILNEAQNPLANFGSRTFITFWEFLLR